MSDVDPSTNGKRPSSVSVLAGEPDDSGSNGDGGEAGGPGQAILLVCLVSASSGVFLVAGALLGAALGAAAGLRKSAVAAPVTVVSLIAGGFGIWLALRLTCRLTDRKSKGRWFKFVFAGGCLGLALAVALATFKLLAVVPVLLIMLPGLGAFGGEMLAARGGTSQPNKREGPELT